MPSIALNTEKNGEGGVVCIQRRLMLLSRNKLTLEQDNQDNHERNLTFVRDEGALHSTGEQLDMIVVMLQFLKQYKSKR